GSAQSASASAFRATPSGLPRAAETEQSPVGTATASRPPLRFGRRERGGADPTGPRFSVSREGRERRGLRQPETTS
ncbi:MAG: hypothetical protein AAFY03_01190, partial [Pseudomonadota bacterium]